MTKYYFILINGTKSIAAHYKCTPKTPKEFWETKHTLNPDDSIVLVCELAKNREGEEVNRTDFYGIEFAKELRRAGVKNKILFTSFCDRKYLSLDPRHTIINTVGHDFIQLPTTPEQIQQKLKKRSALNTESLYICQQSYCSNHALIDSLTHSLRSKQHTDDAYKEKLRQILRDIALLFPSVDTLNDFDSQFLTLNDKNLELAINYVERVGMRAKAENPEEGDAEYLDKPLHTYDIVWLDDEATEKDLIYQKLTEQGIKVHLVSTVPDAIEILEADNVKTRPSIMLAIVDYRLLEEVDGLSIEQDHQGYEFIKWMIAQKQLIKILPYTSISRTIQNYLSAGYSVKLRGIPKRLTDPNSDAGAAYIVNEAIALANENWERITTQPTSGKWKYLKDTYRKIVTSPQYDELEREISERANEWIENYKIGKILSHFKTKVQGNYSPVVDDDEKDITKAKPYFILRRVAPWLHIYHAKKFSKHKLAHILKGQLEKNPKNYFLTAALTLDKSIYGNMTIEERRWAERDHYEFFYKEGNFDQAEKNEEIIREFIYASALEINNYLSQDSAPTLYEDKYEVEYDNGTICVTLENEKVQLNSLLDIRAFLRYVAWNHFPETAITKSIIVEDLNKYALKIKEFAILLRQLMTMLDGVNIPELKKLRTFIRDLCTKQEWEYKEKNKTNRPIHQEESAEEGLYIFYHYPKVRRRLYSTILDQHRNMNEPWKLLKRRNRRYTTKDEKNIREECKEAVNNDNDRYFQRYKYYHIKTEQGKKEKICSVEYPYIAQAYSHRERQYPELANDTDLLLHQAILLGKSSWKTERDQAEDYFKQVKESKKARNNKNKEDSPTPLNYAYTEDDYAYLDEYEKQHPESADIGDEESYQNDNVIFVDLSKANDIADE